MPPVGWRATVENVLLDVLAVVVGAQFGLWGEADWRAKFTLLALVTFVAVGWWRSWQAFGPAVFFGAGAMVTALPALARGPAALRPFWDALPSQGLLVLAALAGAGLGVLVRRLTGGGRIESPAVLTARRRRLAVWLMTCGAALLLLPIPVGMWETPGAPQGPLVLTVMAMFVGWPIGLLLVLLGAVIRWLR